MLSFQEGKACDAIIRYIESRAKAERTDVHFHDTHPDRRRRIELTFRAGGTLYAIEHTGIEPFADFMRMNRESERLFAPIVAAVSGSLSPDEVVQLDIPVGALFEKPKKLLHSIQSALASFVLARSPLITVRSYADYSAGIGPVIPPSVPFAVHLYRFKSPNAPYRFIIKHRLSSDANTMRRERILKACDDKFPKLASWRDADHARTIFILEDNDIQLTNEALVAEAYLPIARARNDRPDETYVMMTFTNTWYVWPILVDNVSYFDLAGRYHPIHLEFDSKDLAPVTSR